MASSSTADREAREQTTTIGTKRPAEGYRYGTRNNAPPAILFAYVCRKASAWYFANPTDNETNRTKTIPAIHQSIQGRHRSSGRKMIIAMVMKMKSAILSKIAPSRVAPPVCLATGPSNISDRPQRV